jgi:hypothetical protein
MVRIEELVAERDQARHEKDEIVEVLQRMIESPDWCIKDCDGCYLLPGEECAWVQARAIVAKYTQEEVQQ